MSKCLGCLKEITENNYCSACLRNLFDNNKNIKPILYFDKNEFLKIRTELADRISISGVQDKISLKIENNELIPTDKKGLYILKPVSVNPVPQFTEEIPANEHLTIQIAKQVFKMKTAENGLIHFSDGELAYITKRFDRVNGNKLRQEDFCQLLNETPENSGKKYKYDSSYEEVGKMIHFFLAASKIEVEKFYLQVLFNYVFGNGDAHLKNFSIIESSYGDYILSPAYDLINTSVHFPNETRMALDLFNNFETKSFKINGFYKRIDFVKFAEKLRVKWDRADRFINDFKMKKDMVIELINRSFLKDNAKVRYLGIFEDRLKAIRD